MTVRIPEVTDDSLLTAVLEYRLFQFRCLFVFFKTHDRKFKKKNKTWYSRASSWAFCYTVIHVFRESLRVNGDWISSERGQVRWLAPSAVKIAETHYFLPFHNLCTLHIFVYLGVNISGQMCVRACVSALVGKYSSLTFLLVQRSLR